MKLDEARNWSVPGEAADAASKLHPRIVGIRMTELGARSPGLETAR